MNGRRMADTLTAFKTRKRGEAKRSNLSPGADPNLQRLDRLRASKIKKAAGPMCVSNLALAFSNENKEAFWTRKEVALCFEATR